MLHLNFTPFPILNTARLLLRPITLNDTDDFFFLRSDNLTNQYTGTPKPANKEEVKIFIQKLIDNVNNNEALFWVLSLKDNPKMIGSFCFWNINKETATGEIGYTLFPEYWGKGYMNEILQAALNYGFNEMKLRTIEAYTHYANAASIKLLDKNNFKLDPSKTAAQDADLICYYSTIHQSP